MNADTIFHQDAAEVDRRANSGHADETQVGPAVSQTVTLADCVREAAEAWRLYQLAQEILEKLPEHKRMEAAKTEWFRWTNLRDAIIATQATTVTLSLPYKPVTGRSVTEAYRTQASGLADAIAVGTKIDVSC